MESHERRLADLRAQAWLILETATREHRRDLTADEETRWQNLYDEIRLLRGETPMMPTTAMSGPGFRVLDSPHFSHADLQRLAEDVWRSAISWGPWPPDWSVRFGELTGEHEHNGAAIFYGRRMIVIDEAKLLRCADIEDDLRTSLIHEICHLIRGPEADAHDPRFYQTLEELRARVPKVIGTWSRVSR